MLSKIKRFFNRKKIKDNNSNALILPVVNPKKIEINSFLQRNNLRAISISNYGKWSNKPSDWLHSIKVDNFGSINFYGFRKNDFRAGKKISEVTEDMYDYALSMIHNIENDAKNIPNSVKRNILVKFSR